MAKQYFDAVAQTTLTAGGGNVTLSTSTTYPGRRTLQDAGATAGTVLPYRLATVDANGVETGEAWETGQGTYLGSNIFERTTPQSGSSTVPVNLPAGTKKFTVTINAADLAPLAEFAASASFTYDVDGTPSSYTVNGTTYTLVWTDVGGDLRCTSIVGGGKTLTINYDSNGLMTGWSVA